MIMQPISDKQREYIRSARRRWNIKTGATRSGKTYLDILYTIPARITERRGRDGLVVLLGNTRGTLQRNILDPMAELYGSSRVGQIRADNTATLFGERCYCLGADNKKHVDRLRGASIKYCYGDEVTTWSAEVFEMLKSRLDKPGACFDGTCNPESPTHWFKKFIDSDADIYSQAYTIDDNPFLPPDFVAELKKEYAGTVYYDRYIRGLWCLAEGLVYPNFGTDCIAPSVNRDYTRWVLSMDYGIQNPTAILLWGYSGGVWYAVDEYYHSGRESGRQKTDLEYYCDMDAFARDLPIECLIIDPSATSYIALCKQRKKYKIRQAVNDVLDGIAKTSGCIGSGKIKICDRCERTIAEFGLYSWDKSASGDKPIKDNDHAMDAVRYFVNTMGIWRDAREKSFSMFGR